MKKGKVTVILLSVLVLLIGAGIGAIISSYDTEEFKEPKSNEGIREGILKEYTTLKVFYAAGSKLELAEKNVPATLAPIELAEIIMKEYLLVSKKYDASVLPNGTKIRNLFFSKDGIIYIDFNREFSRNFQGDALDEYMLLKSIYDTMISNLDITDVMILADGKEIESVGGHLIINSTLKEILTQEIDIDESGSE